jgi:photosystem II stability/assembly factor-like uncharacterized protein
MKVVAIAGTDKGGFLLRSDAARRRWAIEGPLFKGWKVTAAARAADGRCLLATASDVYGAAVHVSDDLKTWTQVEHGPAWSKGGPRKLKSIWTLCPAGPRVYAGVDEAGLFVSEDGGRRWEPVPGLNEHPTRAAWYPGAGGLCAHAILVDPRDPRRIWCGISAVGVFYSGDGGITWEPRNHGIPVVIEDKAHKEVGCCVHGLVADPDDADVIYRRDHVGMFKTRDGGRSWERIEQGLPSWYGFPVAMDRRSRTLYMVPLESDEYRVPVDARLRVYRSRDGGASWQALERGLPQEHCYSGVLRGALAADGLDPGGVYLGTTSGDVFVSSDAGDSWTRLSCTLPRVMCLRVLSDGDASWPA